MEVRIKRIPKPNPDELHHWKYIRREYDYDKGCYKYYYDDTTIDTVARSKEYIRNKDKVGLGYKVKYGVQDALGVDERKAYNTAKNTYELEKDVGEAYQQTFEELVKDVDSDGVRTDLEQSWVDWAKTWPDGQQDEIDSAKKIFDEVLGSYKKTPMYKVDQMIEAVDRGKKKVESLLKRISRKR